MNQRDFGGAIWTDHVLERLGQRGMTQSRAWETFRYPDEKLPGKNKGTTEFQKRIGSSLATVIATKNEQNKWVIISTWIDPPLPGSIDIQKKKEYQSYRKAGRLGKVFLTIKRQLFPSKK